jgi:hypothetical protein
MFYLDYYNRPFILFHNYIKDKIPKNTNYLRSNFWRIIPEGLYENLNAQDLFFSYSKSLEKRAKEIIEKYSIEYWLHLSRRIGIGSGGENKHHVTIITNRFYILALIQKYGLIKRCGHVDDSKKIDISQVFNGLLMSEEFTIERQIIQNQPSQIVFTDFGPENLIEYYKVEKLAYELWVCAAKLRAIGKGAIIVVDQNYEGFFYEAPDEQLDKLIESYDSRLSSNLASETGTVFANEIIDKDSEIFLPVINTNNISITYLKPILKEFLQIDHEGEAPVNFLMVPFPIKKFIKTHLPFDNDFVTKYNISFTKIIATFSALCYRYFYMTVIEKCPTFIKVTMRGYEGVSKKDEIINEINYFKSTICKTLEIEVPSKEEIDKAFEFLELRDQNSIDVFDLSTLKIFLKANEDYYFIDYTVIPTFLDHLFNQIELNHYQFRGELLEKSTGIDTFLPTKPCKSINGEKRQIDFSFRYEDYLILGECKVVSRKNSYFLGSYKAIKLREVKVVNKGLREADEKADWLIRNPVGTNYNIQAVKYILPIAISPFVEYIPSTDKWFWINDLLPRVLSLQEVKSFIDNIDKKTIKYNIKIN